MHDVKCVLLHDNFQNFKSYNIPKAQLILADVVIDPCAGSGSTLRAARELGRNSYGFEVCKEFYTKACEQMLAAEGENE